MKKIFLVLLLVAILFVFCSCNSNSKLDAACQKAQTYIDTWTFPERIETKYDKESNCYVVGVYLDKSAFSGVAADLPKETAALLYANSFKTEHYAKLQSYFDDIGTEVIIGVFDYNGTAYYGIYSSGIKTLY